MIKIGTVNQLTSLNKKTIITVSIDNEMQFTLSIGDEISFTKAGTYYISGYKLWKEKEIIDLLFDSIEMLPHAGEKVWLHPLRSQNSPEPEND